MKNLWKELSLLGVVILPYLYLSMIWNELPQRIPTHFNLSGEADDWSDKSFLLYMPGLLILGIYLFLLYLPKLDPKGRFAEMGVQYFRFRFILFLFLTMLQVYLLRVTLDGNMQHPNVLLGLLGGFFAALGNFFQTIRPNYFMGIRTPWTLESDSVWKKTHLLAGRVWMAGGLLILLLSFFFRNESLFLIISGTILGLLIVVPIVYSYLFFRQEKQLMS